MFKAKTQFRSNVLAICNKHIVKGYGSYFADKRRSDHRSNIDGWSIKYWLSECEDMSALNAELAPLGLVAEHTNAAHKYYRAGKAIQIFRKGE